LAGLTPGGTSDQKLRSGRDASRELQTFKLTTIIAWAAAILRV
jgi:hypothetical protein